jgi:Fic family protein
MKTRLWIWQQPGWPRFHWDATRLNALLRDCVKAQGRLLGMTAAVGDNPNAADELDVLLRNIIASSAIEGETLDVGSVRSSLARRLGVADESRNCVSASGESLAELLLDTTRHYETPLSFERLTRWHDLLFSEDTPSLLPHSMRVGALRGDDVMQVISGRIDRPTVHFEAPPRAGLDEQVADFVEWFNASLSNPELDPLLRAGVAHFWFITLHPFDDGNGRLTRALTDLALAQAEAQAIRLYAMSSSILQHRKAYYSILESSQKGPLDITDWLVWFLTILRDTLDQSMARVDRVLAKTRFWNEHRHVALSDEQSKVINRMLDGGPKGFENGISTAQYQAVAKVSKATATRHLSDLLEKRCLIRLPGSGRSTRYAIAGLAAPIATTEERHIDDIS